MKMSLIMVASLLVSSMAFAGGNGGHGGHTNVNKAESDSTALSGSVSGSLSGGNVTSITSNNDADNEDLAPAVFAPSLTSGSNNCAISVSGGVSVGGIGGSLGVAYESDECNVRESLRVMGGMLRTENNVQAASILKSIGCQSVIYWDAMELAATEVGNPDLACKNERPSRMGRLVLRSPDELPKNYEVATANQKALIDDQPVAVEITSTDPLWFQNL